MDPLSSAVLFALFGMMLDRSEQAETTRKKLAGPDVVLSNDDDKLLFDLFVRLYRETGNLSASDTYAIAQEHRMPGEMVSKMAALVRRCIREDRLSRRETVAEPEHRRIWWTKSAATNPETGAPYDVQMARLVYVNLLDIYKNEGRGGPSLARYDALRRYLDTSISTLTMQYDKNTHEFWAWVPPPSSPAFMTPVRTWNTICRKWPDMVEFEVANDPELKRVRK